MTSDKESLVDGGPTAMHLRHLALPVGDRDRSLSFSSTYFGFEPASARSYPDGTTIVRDDDGSDLALHPVAELDAQPAGVNSSVLGGSHTAAPLPPVVRQLSCGR